MTHNQGGFTWLTVIFGLILIATGLLVFALRFYVMATGGITGQTTERILTVGGKDHEEQPQPATPGADVCVVLSPSGTPRSRGVRSPKAADV